MKKNIYLILCLLGITTGFAKNTNTLPRYGIIIPMTDESKLMLEHLHHKTYKVKQGIHYIEGRIDNKPIVFVHSGLGKANISAITARLIADYHPQVVFLSGSSGNINPHLNNKSVVIGASVMDADLGTLTAKGPYFPNEAYFSSPQNNSQLLKYYPPVKPLLSVATKVVANKKLNTVLGSIATSDVLPNLSQQTALLKRNHMDVVDMESASFMQICWLFQTKCLVVRGVSNDADEEITQQGTIEAGNNAALVVEALLKQL